MSTWTPPAGDPNAARLAVLIELLAGCPDARRAAISWPLVPRKLKGPERNAAWARASGLPRSQLELVADMLLLHEICRADRTVDPLALRVVQRIANEALGGKK